MSTYVGPDVAALEAVPKSLRNVATSGARVRTLHGILTPAAADLDNLDVLRVCKIPSASRVVGMAMSWPTVAAAGSLVLTARLTKEDGTASAQIYSPTTTLTVAGTQIWSAYDSSGARPNFGKPAWQVMGLPADPGGYVELTLLVTNSGSTPVGGTIAWALQIAID